MLPDHGTLTKELYDYVVGVPEFVDITGVTLGAQEPDPTLINLSPPACWVQFIGDTQKEADPSVVPGVQSMSLHFVAFIYLPAALQKALIEQWLPMLLKVSQGVHGQESNTGHRWEYKGQKLVLANTNRLVYAQRYNITAMI